jgi:hypothetical protein
MFPHDDRAFANDLDRSINGSVKRVCRPKSQGIGICVPLGTTPFDADVRTLQIPQHSINDSVEFRWGCHGDRRING